MDFYETLNCERGALLDVIKRQYKELIVKYHPDKNNGQESERFLQIQTAWKTLSNMELRKKYDAELSNIQFSQESTVWCDVNMNHFRRRSDGYEYSCKCGGSFEIDFEQVLLLKDELIKSFSLECDSCSLSIAVQL